MVSIFLSDPSCLEITVEDPNEAFDDLRDYCDYNRLKTSGALDQIKLNLDIDPRATTKRAGVRVPTSKLLDKPLLESIRLKNKIAPRQFDRLVEMHLLSRIPPEVRMSGTARLTQRGRAADENDRAYYFWRLLVKQRIYKKNKDTLIQLDRAERIDKVEETLGDQAGDYERLLGNLEKRLTGEFGLPRRERKRKIIEDDDEDDSDEEEAIEENGGQGRGARGSSKRPRTDDDDDDEE
jgi:histone acetyltransferase 1